MYAWVEPLSWQAGVDPHSTTGGWANLILSLLRPLLLLLWLLIVSRLIHDECLVGDRQFWITKPYNRVSLAISKLFFVLVCVTLPLALMETYLIVHAGLGVEAALPGLLRNLRTFGLICWLPLLAIASVTASLPRMLLVVVSVLLGFFLFTLVVTLNLLTTRATPPFVDTSVSTLFGMVLISTFLFQYVTRYTVASRIALVSAFVVVGILHSTPPSNILYKLRYPSEPERLQYRPTKGKPEVMETPLKPLFGRYVLTIPIQARYAPLGGDEDTNVYDEVASSYTMDGVNVHYNSGWQQAGFNRDKMSVYIEPDQVERLMGGHVKLQVDVVGRRLEPTTASSIGSPNGFNVPGNGRCFVHSSGNRSTLICSYAFASPPRTVVREESEHRVDSKDSSSAHVLHAWVPYPAFDPIAQTAVTLQAQPETYGKFSVIAYQPARTLHATVEVDDLDIAQFLSSGNQ